MNYYSIEVSLKVFHILNQFTINEHNNYLRSITITLNISRLLLLLHPKPMLLLCITIALRFLWKSFVLYTNAFSFTINEHNNHLRSITITWTHCIRLLLLCITSVFWSKHINTVLKFVIFTIIPCLDFRVYIIDKLNVCKVIFFMYIVSIISFILCIHQISCWQDG